ncbi:M57 family metalloprotease [Aquimarina sp. RZ0]|uniref:M57 family metalloprotease n=1 Tax=Aquimarina sp. RZ0 TaxID=2607730 RepID=UPI0011F3BD39|nr:M57 family metalloprotease [Aquimarina sp. RZ0]KAA1245310.1 hypothetical protein F0000_12365 [Aquimarina sp. RZ0]
MKNVIKLSFYSAIIGFSLVTISCENNTDLNDDLGVESAIPVESLPFKYRNAELTEAENKKLTDAGYQLDEVTKLIRTNEDGSKETLYNTSDYSFSPASLEQSLADPSRGYRNANTVFGNRTYTIALVDFGGKYRAAAQSAINDFNNVLRTTVRLRPVFTSFSNLRNVNRDITAYIFDFRGTSFRGNGQGEIPTNNRPGRVIGLNYIRNFESSAKEIGALFKHELLHNFGVEHSDWATRRSCGSIVPVPDDVPRPIAVGGNTSGDFIDALMASCNPFDVFNGVFRIRFTEYQTDDIITMRGIYGFK